MKRAKPAIRSKTIWGIGIGLLGASLPFVTVELAHMPPSPVTRWIGFGVAIIGGALGVYGRTGEPAPVRGLLRVKGSR